MPEQDPIRIFVTHKFAESEDYTRVFEYLESRDNFFYINCSRPDDKPAGGQEEIQDELRNQIKRAEVLIYPVGSVPEKSAMLKFELAVAQAFDKPIMVVGSFGSTISISKEILDIAADMVEWNDRIMTNTVRHLARGEDTEPWDTIDFKLD